MAQDLSVKQHRPPSPKVTAPEGNNLRGGLSSLGGIPGYILTTSILNDPAQVQARRDPRIYWVDGERLLRYITYVRGTRSTPKWQAEETMVPPGPTLAPISPEILEIADNISRRRTEDTVILAVANHAVPGHLGEYFAGRRPLADLVQPTEFKGVWLIPANEEMSQEDRGGAYGPNAELRFIGDLHAPTLIPPPVLEARPFDWIILDTGPSMGFFTRPALAAAQYVLMPIAPGAFADLGLHQLRQTVATMQALSIEPITVTCPLGMLPGTIRIAVRLIGSLEQTRSVRFGPISVSTSHLWPN